MMINYVKHLLEQHKIKKLNKKINEMRSDAKQIIGGVMLELVKYDINFNYEMTEPTICGLDYGNYKISLNFYVYPNRIKIELSGKKIAIYETASWWERMNHKCNLRKFIYTKDAVEAISNMIIMGEAI